MKEPKIFVLLRQLLAGHVNAGKCPTEEEVQPHYRVLYEDGVPLRVPDSLKLSVVLAYGLQAETEAKLLHLTQVANKTSDTIALGMPEHERERMLKLFEEGKREVVHSTRRSETFLQIAIDALDELYPVGLDEKLRICRDWQLVAEPLPETIPEIVFDEVAPSGNALRDSLHTVFRSMGNC